MSVILKLTLCFVCMAGIIDLAEGKEDKMTRSEIRLILPEHGRDRVPSFELSLFDNGEIVFKANKHTQVSGTVKSSIPVETFTALLSKLEQLDFFNLKVEENPIIVGGIPITIFVKIGKRERAITHRNNEVFSKRLHKIEGEIIQIAVSKKWIK